MQDRRRVSSEPWEVAYQKRKSKMEAGGTLPTPFGQAGLVGETGAMNEMDMFAMVVDYRKEYISTMPIHTIPHIQHHTGTLKVVKHKGTMINLMRV